MAKKSYLLFLLLSGIVCFCYGDSRLYVGFADVPLASDAVEAARLRLRQVYTAEIGVREKTNRNDGQRIGEYLNYTRLGEGYAWCAAFVSWCFNQAGYPAPRTAWSPSLFPSKRIIWRKGDRLPGVPDSPAAGSNETYERPESIRAAGTKSARPQKGDVFAIWYGHLKRIGHAGFVDEWGDSMVITVEGNTSDGRRQEGVYRKRRPVNTIYAVADWLKP